MTPGSALSVEGQLARAQAQQLAVSRAADMVLLWVHWPGELLVRSAEQRPHRARRRLRITHRPHRQAPISHRGIRRAIELALDGGRLVPRLAIRG